MADGAMRLAGEAREEPRGEETEGREEQGGLQQEAGVQRERLAVLLDPGQVIEVHPVAIAGPLEGAAIGDGSQRLLLETPQDFF